MIRKRLLVPAVVAAGVLTGCDQTAWLDEVGAPATPTDAAGLAAFLREGTAGIDSAHLELEIDAGGTTITGSGDQTLVDGRTEATDLTETIPGAGDLRIVLVDGETYVQLPAALNTSGKPWVLVAEDSSNPLIRQLAASLESATQSSSVDQYTLFAEASTVQVVGEEEIDGVPATHYSLTVDVTALPNDSPGRRELLGAGVVQLPVELWVDAEGRPVRMTQEVTAGGQEVSTVVSLSDFDEPVTITAPPADQVATD